MNHTLYACFDFRFASDIPLGELTPAATGDDRPIVTIRRGGVPASGATDWQLVCEGESAVLQVPRVARYRMIAGREIIVAPVGGANARDVRLFLLGSALGVIAYQRGLLPLHANAIVVDGRAHAFCGPSGSGKSTLAAYFAAAGYPVLCDDVCALSFDGEGRPLAWPGLPRVKLWRDAAKRLGHDTGTLDRVVERHDKYHVPLATTAVPGPVPLARLYRLDRATDGATPRIERLRGAEAMAAVLRNAYRPEYAAPLGLAAAQFSAAGAVARHAAVFDLQRAWGYDVYEREADRLLAHVRADV